MNPFIINLFKMLMKQSGEEIPEDPNDRRFEELYTLFESLLGKNVLASVPEDKQSTYMALVEKNPAPSMDSIGELIGDCVKDPKAILEKTIVDFKGLYVRNRAKGS
jgi:hypothetical protein